jgi:hypothetical protein
MMLGNSSLWEDFTDDSSGFDKQHVLGCGCPVCLDERPFLHCVSAAQAIEKTILINFAFRMGYELRRPLPR